LHSIVVSRRFLLARIFFGLASPLAVFVDSLAALWHKRPSSTCDGGCGLKRAGPVFAVSRQILSCTHELHGMQINVPWRRLPSEVVILVRAYESRSTA
jgi:hypothetical protein